MKLPAELKAPFARETDTRTVLAAQIVSLLSIVLFPLFGVLDYVLYPHIAWRLVQVRLVTVPLLISNLVILMLLKRRGIADRYSRFLACGTIYPAVAGLDALVMISGGATSPYYAGICLALIAMLVSMPWALREMGGHAVFIWLQYIAVVFLFDARIDDWRMFISNNYFISATVVIGLTWSFTGHGLRVAEFVARRELANEKDRSEKLLLNILPASVAEELMCNGRVEAREVECTILFTDFVGFTDISSRTPAAKLMRSLDRLFVGFDAVIARHSLEKLKTIGDAYMCAGGIPNPSPTHLIDCVLAGLEILDFLETYRKSGSSDDRVWQVRIGIHSGPVTAGVIGQSKFAYDVWGDTVNTASRLESSSMAGQINLRSEVFQRIAHLFDGVDRGQLPVKGKGLVAMTFLTGLKATYAADALRRKPNQAFREVYQRYRHQSSIQDATPLCVPSVVIDDGPMANPKKENVMTDLLSCFAHLTTEDKQEIQTHATEVGFKEHEVLVEQGMPLDTLYVLIEGHVGIQVAVGSGNEASRIEVSVLGPGDLVGEMSFVTGERPTASVVAVEAGRALRVPLAVLDTLMQRSPEFRARLYRSLAALLATRLRDTSSKLPPLITEDVAQVNRHHSTLTGRIAGDAEMPAALGAAIDEFKQGMLEVDRALAQVAGKEERRGVVTDSMQQTRAESTRKVSQLCDALISALRKATREAPDAAQADGIGAHTLRETFPLFMKSRMCDRSFSKPRGYAGDFYTMELVYANQPQGDGRLGPLVDAWFLNIPSARAVRGRRLLLKNLLLQQFRTLGVGDDGTFRALSVGSGSARELFDMFEEVEEQRRVRSISLDIDIEALNFGSQLARDRGLGEQMLWTKENVIHLAKGRGQTRLGSQNMIYSAGLFDYLQDEVAISLLNWMHSHLEPRGIAVIGNFDISSPDRAFMDYILDWRLIYRSPEDMRRLFERSAFGAQKLRIEWEDNRVNHFTVAERM